MTDDDMELPPLQCGSDDDDSDSHSELDPLAAEMTPTGYDDDDELPPLKAIEGDDEDDSESSESESDDMPPLRPTSYAPAVPRNQPAAPQKSRASVERTPAPYSQMTNSREEGAELLRQQHAKQAEKLKDQAASGSAAPAVPAVPAVAAFAVFRESQIEDLKRLRKEKGFVETEGSKHKDLCIGRCHLRPGTMCDRHCEIDTNFFLVKSAERRILLNCTKGCRMLYHYPTCWGRFTMSYKKDVDPNWTLKPKDTQFVRCVTDKCTGCITSAMLVEGTVDEETREVYYQMPTKLREQLEEEKNSHVKAVATRAQMKIEARKRQEENSEIKRQRKATRAAQQEKEKTNGEGVDGDDALAALANGKHTENGAAASSSSAISSVQADTKQPAVKVYSAGGESKSPENGMRSLVALPDDTQLRLLRPAQEEARLTETDISKPKATGTAVAAAAAAAAAPSVAEQPIVVAQAAVRKKKKKMVPLDPREIGFTTDYTGRQQYDEYYDEAEDYDPAPAVSQDYVSYQEKQYIRREAYTGLTGSDDVTQGLVKLRLDNLRGGLTNHLLVGNLDIDNLIAATNHQVDSYLRNYFGKYGEVIHFRIFTRQEAAAISFRYVDNAILAWCREHGSKMHRNLLDIDFLMDFPNDTSLSWVVPTFVPSKPRHNTANHHTIAMVKWVDELNLLQLKELHLTDQEILTYLKGYRYQVCEDCSQVGQLPPRPPNYLQPHFRQNFLTPGSRSETMYARAQQQAPPATLPPSSSAVAAAAASARYSTAPAAAPAAAAAPVSTTAAVASTASSSSTAAAVPVVSGIAARFDAVQVIGCNTEHLRQHYRQYPLFKLGRNFFVEAHRIVTQERTALALYNVDTRTLEGLWEAVTITSQEVEFKAVEEMPSLPLETFAPLLPPSVLTSDTMPIVTPARLHGQHVRLILQAFANAKTPPPTPTPTPTPTAITNPTPTPAALVPATVIKTRLAPTAREFVPSSASPPVVSPVNQPVPPSNSNLSATSSAPASYSPPTAAPNASTRAPTPPHTPPIPPITTPATSPAMSIPRSPTPTAQAPPQAAPPAVSLAPSPAIRPAFRYNPIAPVQIAATQPPAMPPVTAPAVPHDVSNFFPFLLAQSVSEPARPTHPPAFNPPPAATAPPIYGNPVLHPMAQGLRRTSAPLPPSIRPAYSPVIPPTPPPFNPPPATLARTPSQPLLHPNNLPFAYAPNSMVRPAPITLPSPPATPPLPPAATTPPAMIPTPPPTATPPPTPTDPIASRAAAPAAAAKKSRHMCPLCSKRRFRYLHITCRGSGPCGECMPDESHLATVYPTCLTCGKATTQEDLVKVHW